MIIWKKVKKYKTKRSNLNLNKERLDRKRTERTQENINLQEKLNEDPRISARKNGLNIRSTFSRITKRDFKCHFYKMHVRKIRNNYK